MERSGLAAVFVIIIEDGFVVDVVVLERDQPPVRGCTQPHALLGAGAVTDRLEHHLAAEHQFDRLAELPRRRDGERTMRPWK